MSDPVSIPHADSRLLSFEVGGVLYALPIVSVIEVTEADGAACIPTLPTRVGGVINYHGDALPVVSWSSLFDMEDTDDREVANVLVITDRTSGVARLGLAIDRVLGLVDGVAASSTGPNAIAERRSIDGRLANVLDPKRLVAQAREAIDASLGRIV